MNRENLGIFLLGFGTGFFSVGTIVCGMYFYGKKYFFKLI